MRKAFIRTLCDIARKDKRIYLITGDLGFTILEPFRDTFPERFLNVGVAEANLISVAAGLSTMGFIPFVYSIATFATMRPFEQIRNDICLQNLNVKIIGVGGGLAYTKAGPTHHAMEDIALMRLLPNMQVIVPSDIPQIRIVTKQLVQHVGPAYVRFERNHEENRIENGSTFKLGKGITIQDGKKIAIITTGTMLSRAITVAQLLKKSKIDAGIFSMPSIKPFDIKLLKNIAKLYEIILTLEEHSIVGGLGSVVLESLNQDYMTSMPQIIRFGLKPAFIPISADYKTLMKYNGLLPDQIVRRIKIIYANTFNIHSLKSRNRG